MVDRLDDGGDLWVGKTAALWACISFGALISNRAVIGPIGSNNETDIWSVMNVCQERRKSELKMTVIFVKDILILHFDLHCKTYQFSHWNVSDCSFNPIFIIILFSGWTEIFWRPNVAHWPQTTSRARTKMAPQVFVWSMKVIRRLKVCLITWHTVGTCWAYLQSGFMHNRADILSELCDSLRTDQPMAGMGKGDAL